MFLFYAAITKLKTPGIDEIITEIISMRSKPHLLSLLHCLHEAQDPSLCQCVAKQLKTLQFGFASLNPLDLLSVGYLISMSSTDVVKGVCLAGSDIGDYSVKNLMTYTCGKSSRAWNFIMTGNNIHEEGAAILAEVLQTSGVMNSLNLDCNPIGGRGLQSIAKALITNSSLIKLDLDQCSLEITEENGPVVAEMLQRNRGKTLRKLDLMNNIAISEIGVLFIAEGLKKNSALECISMNRISARGGKALASAIATNASLPLVDLSLRGVDMITEYSKPAFVDMLQQKTSLETFMISSGIFVPLIAEALQENTTLKELILWSCKLSPDVVRDVSRMLAVNRSLITLNIPNSPIGDNGIYSSSSCGSEAE